MRRPGAVALILVGLSAGCADHYRGRMPDLNVTDPTTAEQEVRDFTITSGFLGMRLGDHRYSRESLAPVIHHVSPPALEELDRSQAIFGWSRALVGAAGAANAIAWTAIEDDDLRTQISLGGLGLLAVSTGLSLWGANVFDSALTRYNVELRRAVGGGSRGTSFRPPAPAPDPTPDAPPPATPVPPTP